MSWFAQGRDSKIYEFLYTVTEPLVLPFRHLLDGVRSLRNVPIDIASVSYTHLGGIGVCFADITTGEVYATGSESWQHIFSELGRFGPREVLVGGMAVADATLLSFLKERLEALVEPMPEDCFGEMCIRDRYLGGCYHHRRCG